ncbi:MAG: hypothetical protein Q8L05_05180, partial [Actinomycetota bacterium]|nr:hypothetical protein [Actinomycetota bacterium]
GTDQGPVFDPNSDATGGTWGDIIPAFGDFAGYNNTGTGAEIFANDCAVPATVGGNPDAWNICHWSDATSPPGYQRITVSAASTTALIELLKGHANETSASGKKDIIPATRTESANLECPGTTPVNPRSGYVGSAVSVSADMCMAESGTYGYRTETVTESAIGPDQATAKRLATTRATTALVRQLRDLQTQHPAAIIESVTGYPGFHWGREGQTIFANSCVVLRNPKNSELLGVSGSAPVSGLQPVTGK